MVAVFYPSQQTKTTLNDRSIAAPFVTAAIELLRHCKAGGQNCRNSPCHNSPNGLLAVVFWAFAAVLARRNRLVFLVVNAVDIIATKLYLHGLLVNNIFLLKNARTITKHISERSIWVSCGKCCVFCQVPKFFFFGYYTTIICSSLFSTTSYNFIKIRRMLKLVAISLY